MSSIQSILKAEMLAKAGSAVKQAKDAIESAAVNEESARALRQDAARLQILADAWVAKAAEIEGPAAVANMCGRYV